MVLKNAIDCSVQTETALDELGQEDLVDKKLLWAVAGVVLKAELWRHELDSEVHRNNARRAQRGV